MTQRSRILLAACAAMALAGVSLQQTVSTQGGPAQILRAADVLAIIQAAASSLNDPTLAVGVVDRAGTILGVYRRPGAAATSPDVAVSLARTTAFFSNDQAPLSSRTVRFISGIHFPPGIQNTPQAPLYGIENTNRGCELDPAGDAVFNPGKFVPRPRSIAGTFSAAAGVLPLPCDPSDTRGCAAGGPIAGPDGRQNFLFGITTGKVDTQDSPQRGNMPVNGGGIALYRAGKLIGGVGVAGVSPERAEFAAVVAAAGTRGSTGITTAISFPSPALPEPGAVYIDGLRLPFFRDCTTFECVQDAVDNRPSGSSPGSFNPADLVVPSAAIPAPAAQDAPEGYLIGPRGSVVPGGLTEQDVRRIVDQAVARADATRAQVRLPIGQTVKVIIAVTDSTGRILAEYRMPDALMDAVDVVPAKARNSYYFSTREGYNVLRSYVLSNRYDNYEWTPEPPAGQGWAITTRTIGFGGQPLFPPGIDRGRTPTPGPWFDMYQYDSLNPCTEGPGPSRGANRSFRGQNGVTWFPGSAPLYKNGVLVGGLGVSGDGIDQNDYVTAAGAAGFEPPAELRVDQSIIRTSRGETRLPYLKFPRNPETK